VILAVAKAKREDTGKYTVQLKNPSGVETATVNVNVLGTLFTPGKFSCNSS
jgi:hypothetical protein